MITSKIKEVKSVSEPYGQYKVLYHKLIMENDDKIDIGKQKEQQVGWELTYEIVGDGQQEYNKAKAVSPDKFKSNGQTSYNKNDNIQEKIIRQVAAKCGTELGCAYIRQGHTVSIEDVQKMAQAMEDWINEIEIEAKTKKKDDLPF
jgi:hypothetical protein